VNLGTLEDAKVFHVQRSNNGLVDQMVNDVIYLGKRPLVKNGNPLERYCHP